MIGLLMAVTLMGAGHATSPRVAGPAVAVYTVQRGDSLWSITGRMTGTPWRWPALYVANRAVIGPNPDLVYPGERLTLALPAVRAIRHDGPGTHRIAGVRRSAGPVVAPRAAGPAFSFTGHLGCSGLERLWDAAGGNPADAFTAAEVAMAESGGYQWAHSPTDDYGYWQINASNGALATFDPMGNARAAVILSADGTDWQPWTTWRDGAYAGRCLADLQPVKGRA